MGINDIDNDSQKYYKINNNKGKGNEPKNFKFYSKRINNFEIEYTWKFILDNQNISIIYIHNLKLNERQILFNNILIRKELFDGNKYTYEFYKKDYIYKIVHENDFPDFYIYLKNSEYLNSFRKKKDNEKISNNLPAPEPTPCDIDINNNIYNKPGNINPNRKRNKGKEKPDNNDLNFIENSNQLEVNSNHEKVYSTPKDNNYFNDIKITDKGDSNNIINSNRKEYNNYNDIKITDKGDSNNIINSNRKEYNNYNDIKITDRGDDIFDFNPKKFRNLDEPMNNKCLIFSYIGRKTEVKKYDNKIIPSSESNKREEEENKNKIDKNRIKKENKLEDNIQIKENESFLINIKFINLKTNILYPIKNLSGLLNLCLIKYISNYFTKKEITKILSSEQKRIIKKLQNNIKLGEDNRENIKMILNENKGNNILIYSQYINEIFNDVNEIKKLINLLEKKKKEEIDIYCGCLSNYNEYNIFFEKEFKNDLKKTIFDYSLISLAILEKKEKNEEEYKSKRDASTNNSKRILYHGSQIDPISKILTDEFKYTRKAFYGMGIYFSDMIDYIAFYCGGTGLSNRRDNFGSIVPVYSTFSFIASEVFYDKNKFKQIKDMSLNVPELDHFPSYNEIKRKYSDKMVEPNGIHFTKVNDEGSVLTEKDICDNNYKGEFVGNEYVITEKYQIFPIYSLTVKRNEYFVLWRDSNFKGENYYSDYLQRRKLFCMEKANMNIYFESSIEESLKFLLRRQYNKVILITSIGLDLSGKRFVEIARKIFGFDMMVLFFSANEDHLKWIQKFQNCLYTDQSNFYEEYITNFNKDGLEKLKKDVEKEYNITLMEFSENFLSYPNFKNEGDFSSLKFNNNDKYIRHVKIRCKNKDLFLKMNKNGKVKLSIYPYMWDVTIIDNEITLFSNGFYLDVTKRKNGDKEEIGEELVGYKYMIIWRFMMYKKYYILFYSQKGKENILSSENKILKVMNKVRTNDDELFELIDEIEE